MSTANSQSWKVRFNGKVLLSSSVENEKANSRKLALVEWKKNGFLEISYKEPNRSDWKRSLLIFDEADNEIMRFDSMAYAKISIADLREKFAHKKQIRIYTVVSPLDPNIAVRVRRVHLCTLRIP